MFCTFNVNRDEDALNVTSIKTPLLAIVLIITSYPQLPYNIEIQERLIDVLSSLLNQNITAVCIFITFSPLNNIYFK